LRHRKTEDPDVLLQRFNTASRELNSALKFDYVVFNESDRVERAVEDILSIVDAERFRLTDDEVII
ncbi:MAG: guanylate kinase, partial [Ilumatobacteraceae bacterium]